jgi:hypothetical protein
LHSHVQLLWFQAHCFSACLLAGGDVMRGFTGANSELRQQRLTSGELWTV